MLGTWKLVTTLGPLKNLQIHHLPLAYLKFVKLLGLSLIPKAKFNSFDLQSRLDVDQSMVFLLWMVFPFISSLCIYSQSKAFGGCFIDYR